MKMRTFYKKNTSFYKKNCPLLFIKNSMLQIVIYKKKSIFGKNIHPCCPDDHDDHYDHNDHDGKDDHDY